MVKEGVVVIRSHQRGREDHSVEGDVILPHELVKLDILRVLPPLLPLLGVSGSDGDIADWSVKPHIEDLVLHVLEWHWGSPLQVTGDAAGLQALLKPGLGNRVSVC